MKTTAEPEFRRARQDVSAGTPWSRRWYGRLVLLSVSVGLLTLAYAPIKQFYLAWIGLVPWLVVIARCRSYKSAFFWGWLSGTMFFIANMWWMWYVTSAGMIGLMAILALYWGVMAAVVFGVWGLGSGVWGRKEDNSRSIPQTPDPKPQIPVLLIATAWTALEFIRGNFIWHGLPWLYLGHTQTPILAVCQIADTLGVYGVSFWIALLNAVGAAWVLSGYRFDAVRRSLPVVVVLTAFIVLYGIWRIEQTVPLPGPTVMVVQSNYPQSNTGDKGATEDEILRFHYETTKAALQEHSVDLVVWSETMMPPINEETLLFLRGTRAGQSYDSVARSLRNIAGVFQTGLIVGGRYEGGWRVEGQYARATETRNSAYFIERSGLMSDLRYDKIHIVPFGEFLPFRQSLPWVFEFIKKVGLGPPDMDDYQLNAGDEDNLTVFPLRRTNDPLDLSTWRFVTPICFEDIDSDITARMFRPGADGLKRADFLVNMTNDGWFKANENTQHVQAATFRSIENRVPSARSVNTGVSGFIDSVGRVHDTVAVRTAGVAIAKLSLDARVTFYTKYGDVFVWICVCVTGSAMLLKLVGSRKRSKIVA